jgi:4-hydroxy-tetrahydrodipicolinate reductase
MSNTNKHSKKIYRVVQWAAGRIGQSAMRATIRHPQLELVGLYVHSESKQGRDAGELCGLGPIGVRATRSIDAVIALKPDCVLYMQEGYNVDDMCRLLESGINIVTTRSEFFYAKTMNPQIRQRIESACEKGGSSLFATGSSPGFITEVLPLALLYMSRRLDCITIDEFADIPASTSPEMVTNVMGFGRPLPKEFNEQMLEHVAVGFAQSLAAVAEGIGLSIDKFETIGEFALANSPVALPGGAVIETGMLAAQRITVAGIHNGKPLLKFRANWYCSRDIDKDWQLKANGWRVLIEGDTPMEVNISYPRSSDSFADQMSGLTAHPAVNAITYVCDAVPGIRTNVDLPTIIPRLLSGA